MRRVLTNHCVKVFLRSLSITLDELYATKLVKRIGYFGISGILIQQHLETLPRQLRVGGINHQIQFAEPVVRIRGVAAEGEILQKQEKSRDCGIE